MILFKQQTPATRAHPSPSLRARANEQVLFHLPILFYACWLARTIENHRFLTEHNVDQSILLPRVKVDDYASIIRQADAKARHRATTP